MTEDVDLQNAILFCMKSWEKGYWHGYDYLNKNIRSKYPELSFTIDDLKQTLKKMRREGLVKVGAIYNSSNGKLNGKGYFR